MGDHAHLKVSSAAPGPGRWPRATSWLSLSGSQWRDRSGLTPVFLAPGQWSSCHRVRGRVLDVGTVPRVIDIVGVPFEGPEALPPASRTLIEGARTLIGSPRLLEHLPVVGGQRRESWPSPLLPALPGLMERVGAEGVVVLATGDPLRSGIGSTLVRLLGADAVRIHPAVSSVGLARARMGWSAEETVVVSLVSAPVPTLRRQLTPAARLVVLSAGAHTPGDVAHWLVEQGCGPSRMTVLGHLGGDDESRIDTTAETLAATAPGIPALNVVALEVITAPGRVLPGSAPGREDDAFDHDGQITKSEIRALALAALRPMRGQLLWDLGAGSGSVSIEWCLMAEGARAVAVESNLERAARVTANAAAFGVTVEVVHAASSEVIADLEAPDAVFIGGGASGEVVDAAWQRLRPGGRLVVHAVTLETEAVVISAQAAHGGHLRRVSVERAEPLGRFLSWTPARSIVLWSATKES